MRRRTFLARVGAAPAAAVLGNTSRPCRRYYEGVLGTSMELTVWARPDLAERAFQAVLDEIERLDLVLSTYRPDSDISRYGDGHLHAGSAERAFLLTQYADWQARTGGAISSRINGRLNVDALGKAFIADRAAAATIGGGADGVLLNIGGDVVARGPAVSVDVTNPARPFDNDEPLTRLRLSNRAVATSGSYARGGHLVDPRNGGLARGAASATVVAADCLTANALATSLCVLPIHEGLALIEEHEGAEALVTSADGTISRTSGFASLEQATPARSPASGSWPPGYEMRIALTLTGQAFGGGGRGRGLKAPYVAIWVEDTAGRYVRTLAVWGDKWKYLEELTDWWRFARNDRALNTTATRATRPAGEYRVAWNGLDDTGNPMPQGSYKINVEVSREHGTYARKSGTIACAAAPATITLPETAEFAPIVIAYGPRA